MNVTMKIYRVIICLSICSVCLAACGCGGSSFAHSRAVEEYLKPQFELNMPYQQRLEMKSDMLLPLGIPNADHKESSMVMECMPVSADEAGNTIVEATIVSLEASMVSLGVEASYDSENLPADMSELDNRSRHFYDVFDGLVNLKYTAVVDRRGGVVELRNVPSRISQAMEGQIEGSIGEDQLIMLFCRENLMDIVSPSYLATLEDTAIEPNDTWQGKQTIVVPRAVAVVGDRTCTLAGYETSQDGEKTASITYRTVATADMQVQDGRRRSGGLEIVQAAAVGSSSYSVTNGHPISINEDMRAEIRTTQAGSQRRESRNRIFYDIKRQILWLD